MFIKKRELLKIRSTKFEFRNKFQFSKIQNTKQSVLDIHTFEFRICFVLRYSDFALKRFHEKR